MFAKVYQYKFGTVAEAKVAASFCSDNLGKKISQYKFQSLASATYISQPTGIVRFSLNISEKLIFFNKSAVNLNFKHLISQKLGF